MELKTHDMTTMKEDQQTRVRSLLTDAVTLLCRTGLRYNAGFTVEGLLGITIDNADVFLVNIRETVLSSSSAMLPASSAMSVSAPATVERGHVGGLSSMAATANAGTMLEMIGTKQCTDQVRNDSSSDHFVFRLLS